ncbi:MAG TPA: tetratricopeptide repeat protein, partial [Vicinamibacteria bacterium]|nr:tetratricopeptide repeat protein [Vicinamibacteria bacterium]
RIESFQGGPRALEAAQKAVAADPTFAFGHDLVAVNTPPAQNKPLFEKAAELAKGASEAERRYMEAHALNRAQKGAEALEAYKKLAADYPDERMVHMMIGQIATGQGHLDLARAAYEKAMTLDAGTPRVHALLANVHVLQNDYAGARRHFQHALERQAAGTAPGQIHFGLALTYVYEGNVDQALATLRGFADAYRQTAPPTGLPEVFIWNAMGRINLENGRLPEALAAYEKGFQSVPGSSLAERDKKIWEGRLHHGRGRTLARMGKHEEAWKEADVVKKMIDEGGEDAKEFLPAYHYLAGYIKLEAGDAKAAVEHLKQADQADPFHKLLLARAYEKVGDKESARKAYEEVVANRQPGLDRALAYPEAKKRLASL